MRERLSYICETYKVPAKKGGRIRFEGVGLPPSRTGTILGARNGRLRVRFDGETYVAHLHPEWNITYLPKDTICRN